jgi:hypothetical protein
LVFFCCMIVFRYYWQIYSLPNKYKV